MKVGDIVYLKSYRSIFGEVISMNDRKDIVTIILCDTGAKLIVDACEVEVTESNQPHREAKSTVNILGTQYTILVIDKADYRYDREADGWCDAISKEILIFNFEQSPESLKDLVAYQKKVLRHEIIHAFLYESGLWQNSRESNCWAKNEEMVDWIAIQEPKIHKAFLEAGCSE